MQLIESIASDHPFIDVMPITTERLRRGFTLYKTHSDKEWSLTDCISFDLMREHGVREALDVPAIRVTADGADLSLLRWGVQPSWAQRPFANATIEKLEKGAWSGMWPVHHVDSSAMVGSTQRST